MHFRNSSQILLLLSCKILSQHFYSLIQCLWHMYTYKTAGTSHPPPQKNAERDIEMGTQLLSCCEIIPPDGRDLKISLHYIMEICQEDNVYIREPRSRLSLFSQRAQLHDIIYLCFESTVAAMKSIQTVLPSHPTERQQVLLGTVLNTA